MVDSFRNSLIGLLCLSVVGCGSMSDSDAGATGMVVVGLGALAAIILLSDSDDDKGHKGHRGHSSRDSYKGGHGKGNGKGHSGRR